MTFAIRASGITALLLALVASPTHAGCVFGRMPVKAGMSRLDLETRVAALLGTPNAYSPYGNNLAGGMVSYRSGDCELQVTFAPGAPAPQVAVAGKGVEHLPPMDETVLSYTLVLDSGTQQH